jgi:hypothetical protein
MSLSLSLVLSLGAGLLVLSVYGCRAFMVLQMISVFICIQYTSCVLEFLAFVIKVLYRKRVYLYVYKR